MKLTKKEYTDPEEERSDFTIGIGVFIGLNIFLFLINAFIVRLIITSNSTVSTSQPILYDLIFLINIGVLIYFLFTRVHIARGMMQAFAALLMIGAVVGGRFFLANCFETI